MCRVFLGEKQWCVTDSKMSRSNDITILVCVVGTLTALLMVWICKLKINSKSIEEEREANSL